MRLVAADEDAEGATGDSDETAGNNAFKDLAAGTEDGSVVAATVVIDNDAADRGDSDDIAGRHRNARFIRSSLRRCDC